MTFNTSTAYVVYSAAGVVHATAADVGTTAERTH